MDLARLKLFEYALNFEPRKMLALFLTNQKWKLNGHKENSENGYSRPEGCLVQRTKSGLAKEGDLLCVPYVWMCCSGLCSISRSKIWLEMKIKFMGILLII